MVEETPEAKSERLTRRVYSRLREEIQDARGKRIHGKVRADLTIVDGKVVKVVVWPEAEEV